MINILIGISVFVHDKIKTTIDKVCDNIYDKIWREIKINIEDNPKIVFAIKEHLRNKENYLCLMFQEIEIIPSYSNTSFKYMCFDGYDGLNYEIANGVYKVPNEVWHKITDFDIYKIFII